MSCQIQVVKENSDVEKDESQEWAQVHLRTGSITYSALEACVESMVKPSQLL